MLRLNVGVSRKVGLPDYGSAGASCHIEVELPSELLGRDLDGFHERVRGAYVAAQQAVNDELSRLRPPATPFRGDRPAAVSGHAHPNGSAAAPNGSHTPASSTRARPRKPATANQVRALVTISRRQQADLQGLLRDDFGVERPEDLSVAEASRLIDQLKAAAEL
jgi:hypothetical protein